MSTRDRLSVESYRDIYAEYAEHPEVKAAATDATPCQAATRGLLQPLVVKVDPLRRIGKAANRLADTEDVVDGPEDQPGVYDRGLCMCCFEQVSPPPMVL